MKMFNTILHSSSESHKDFKLDLKLTKSVYAFEVVLNKKMIG
jgi:hypothetical protein